LIGLLLLKNKNQIEEAAGKSRKNKETIKNIIWWLALISIIIMSIVTVTFFCSNYYKNCKTIKQEDHQCMLSEARCFNSSIGKNQMAS
jgi:hypothetical protein